MAESRPPLENQGRREETSRVAGICFPISLVVFSWAFSQDPKLIFFPSLAISGALSNDISVANKKRPGADNRIFWHIRNPESNLDDARVILPLTRLAWPHSDEAIITRTLTALTALTALFSFSEHSTLLENKSRLEAVHEKEPTSHRPSGAVRAVSPQSATGLAAAEPYRATYFEPGSGSTALRLSAHTYPCDTSNTLLGSFSTFFICWVTRSRPLLSLSVAIQLFIKNCFSCTLHSTSFGVAHSPLGDRGRRNNKQ